MSLPVETASSDRLFPSRARIIRALAQQLTSIEEYASRKPVRFAFISVAAAFIAVIFLCAPVFETNDDVVMSMIASGTGVGDRPDEHIVFSNFLIGLALRSLYTVIPQIPWYGAYLIFVNYLANVAIVYSVTTWRYRRSVGACFLLLFATVSVQLLIRLQFTSTAMWVTEAGILTILTALCRRHEDTSWNAVPVLISGAGLMVLGSLVRFEAYIAAVVVVTVPFIFLVWRMDRSATNRTVLPTWKLALTTGVVIQLIAFGLLAANFGYYHKDATWREFFKFNPYRVKFNDYQWTSYNAQSKWIFDQVQWTENDYNMLSLYWFFDDDRVYNREKLQTVINGYPWVKTTARWRQFGTFWLKLLGHPLLWPIWMQLPFHLWFARNQRSTLLQLMIMAVSIDGIVCGLMMLKTPVFRMFYPLFAFQILISLVFIRWGQPSGKALFSELPFGFWFWWQQSSSRWRIGFDSAIRPVFLATWIAIIAMLGAGWSVGKAVHLSRKTVAAHKLLFADLERIKPQDDELYVCWGGCFPYESVLPLQAPAKMKNVHLLCLGWTQKSPVNKAVKDRFQIEDLTLSLRDKPNVYLISTSVLNHLYSIYVQEHYDIEFAWKPCFSSKAISVFKPVQLEESDEAMVDNFDSADIATEVDLEMDDDDETSSKVQQTSSSSDGPTSTELVR